MNQIYSLSNSDDEKQNLNRLFQVNNEISDATKLFNKQIEEIKLIHNQIISSLFEKRQIIVNEIINKNSSKSKFLNSSFENFWKISLSNNDLISKMITKEDEDVLSYLKNIKINTLSNERETIKQLEFIYENNPFFSNTSLVKTFKFDKFDGGILSIGSSEIDWKEGKNYTKNIERKVLINKSKIKNNIF